jgi:transposase
MNKNTEIFGIDISKDVFDVYSHKKGHQSFKNDAQGFILSFFFCSAIVL